MAYYVSVVDGGKKLFAAGPFNRHGDALAHVAPVREIIKERFPREAPWVAIGTAHTKTSRDIQGKFNKELGLAA